MDNCHACPGANHLPKVNTVLKMSEINIYNINTPEQHYHTSAATNI